MKLQQLRYICEVARHKLNISQTAEKLHTSQPGISKQIRLLEEELGTTIFIRNGKHLSQITPAGEKIIEAASEILQKASTIRSIAEEFEDSAEGRLSIATTHTQSRYILPRAIKPFTSRYPDVSLHIHQGSPLQISQLAADGTADFAIATEGLERFNDLVTMPCFHWNRSILVPRDHPLAQASDLSLKEIARHPIVTYVAGFTGRSKLDEAFEQAGLQARVVVAAADADVIKTYVRLGLGIGIIASMAWESDRDSDLVALDASHLFEFSTTSISFRRETYLRSYMFDFIEMFAPHLNRDRVEEAMAEASREKRQQLFSQVEIPVL